MPSCVFDDNGRCIFCGDSTNGQCPAFGTIAGVAGKAVAEELPTRDAPGFLTKVKNFAAAAAHHVAAGMPMASDEEIIRRHDICLTCEHLQNDACNLCGCPVSRVAGYVSKLSWADQECPIGKWGKVVPQPPENAPE